MTIAEYCLLAAVFIWLFTIGIAKISGFREYNNALPRDEKFYNIGWRQRCLAAHQNAAEAFPIFASAVILAEIRWAPRSVIDGLAMVFIACRVLYVFAYLADKPTLRSFIWSVAFIVNVAIFLSPIWAR
jgi:uncharacterized MAPEG superfamily protein